MSYFGHAYSAHIHDQYHQTKLGQLSDCTATDYSLWPVAIYCLTSFSHVVTLSYSASTVGCRWTLKPEFGEVPQYLIRNKKQIAEEKANVEEHIRLRQQQVSLANQ